jgi:hypothetical protein
MKEIREQRLTEEEAFLFKTIEAAVNGLHKAFPDYSEEYILERLAENSMNIYDTYVYLKNPSQSNLVLILEAYYPFTQTDDFVLRGPRENAEFGDLLKIKSERRIAERMNYLNITI